MSRPSILGDSAQRAARAAAGLMLFAGAALKAGDLLSARQPSGIFGALPAGARYLLVAAELVLAIWLLSPFKPRLSGFVVGFVFLWFSVVSAWAAMREKPCGCFGSLVIPPGVICVADAIVATLLLPRIRVLPLGALLVVVPVISWMDRGAERPVRILRPDEWVGKAWPLFDEARIEANVRQGSWKLLFFDPRCHRCQELLRRPQAHGVAINVTIPLKLSLHSRRKRHV